MDEKENIKELVYKDYMSGMKYKDISEKHGVPIETIRWWRRKKGWKRERGPSGGAPKGNKNAKGGRGGGAPNGNTNGEKHGFFTKFLPDDVLDIIREVENKTPLDMLWEQITIQYATIIRAQRLMYVRDQQDKTVEIIQQSETGTTYEYQQAWDKYEKLMAAQSRAMTALNSMISQYEKMANASEESEERIERIKKMRLESEKIKTETERIKSDAKLESDSIVFCGDELLEN